MTENVAHLALFDELDPVTDAIVSLRELGIPDREMEVISGIPFSERILGRPEKDSMVPLLAIFGMLLGLGAGVALNFGTPLLYPIYVGGKPLMSIPTGLVLIFETTMLGLLLFTFLGVFLESVLPSYKAKPYHLSITDGKIALIFHCAPADEARAYEALKKLGVAEIGCAEAKKL